MTSILNIDHWDWVDPETNRVVRLRRGDEVPDRVLSFSEDPEAFYLGRNPVMLKGEGAKEAAGPKSEAAAASQGDPHQSQTQNKGK
jgi:hypothetical protein